MRRLTAVTLFGVTTLMLGGCGFINGLLNGGESDTVADSQPLEAVPIPQDQPAGEGFPKPVVAAGSSVGAIASAELIQPTNANERVKLVRERKARSDPFASLPVPPPPPKPAPAASAGGNSSSSGGSTATNNGGAGTSGSGSKGSSGGGSQIQSLPPLPQPNLARAVEVTGVVEINGKSYAIVKAPGEPTSRYVSVGQRLSGGQILVKRIEVREVGEPVVILEQNGVEVARAVAAPAEAPAVGEPPQATLPEANSVTVNTFALPVPQALGRSVTDG